MMGGKIHHGFFCRYSGNFKRVQIVFRPLVLALMVLLPAVAAAQGETVPAPDDSVATDQMLPYEPSIVGVEGNMEALLRGESQLYALKGRPPATILGLRRRVAVDAEAFGKAFESEGYYASSVTSEVDTSVSPASVVLTVQPGPRYLLESFSVVYEGTSEDFDSLPRTAADVGLTVNEPARADSVLQAIDRLSIDLRTQGHPFVHILGHSARVDHASQTMQVEVNVDPGPLASFGKTAIGGLETVDEAYVRQQLPWESGEGFDQRKVQTLRRTLLATSLFTAVRVETADTVDEDGSVPMSLQVEEAKHRSIGVGARYSTSLGPSLHAYWEHRNLFGANETVHPELTLGLLEQAFTTTFRKPDYLRKDQDFLASAKASSEVLEAYDSTSISASAGLERKLSPIWKAGAGVEIEWAEITDIEGSRTSQLIGFPLTARRDGTNDQLDPTEGTRLSLTVSPYAGTYDGPTTFVKVLAEGSAYQALDDAAKYVLAGRTAIGSMIGASRSGVPADKRFYSGGGGSLRGFAYQLAGELDSANKPEGGKALLEAGIELRVKLTDSVGVVPFLEAGRAFSEASPTLSEDLFLGTGLGIRYYSPVGPIRFDVGIPLNSRKDIDDPFQIYISLGQAF